MSEGRCCASCCYFMLAVWRLLIILSCCSEAALSCVLACRRTAAAARVTALCHLKPGMYSRFYALHIPQSLVGAVAPMRSSFLYQASASGAAVLFKQADGNSGKAKRGSKAKASARK